MRNLVLFLHQIQLIFNSRVVLVLILSDLEQYFYHVLYSLVNVGFIQDIPKLIKHRQCNWLIQILQLLANFSC